MREGGGGRVGVLRRLLVRVREHLDLGLEVGVLRGEARRRLRERVLPRPASAPARRRVALVATTDGLSTRLRGGLGDGSGGEGGGADGRPTGSEHAPQPHTVDDAVLADVLDSVLQGPRRGCGGRASSPRGRLARRLRLLRHLLELVEVEDDAHLCERARLRLHVRHHEAARAVEEDVVIHRPVPGFEDV